MSRIRWLHLYSLLAGFDMLVIAGGIWLYQTTARDFGALLNQQALSDARQRHLAALGQTILAINAPGNDVFRNRDWSREQSRFQRMSAELGAIKARGRVLDSRLSKFWKEVQDMVRSEERIFELLAELPSNALPIGRDSRKYQLAMQSMARMDEHQASALRLLASEQEAILSESAETLTNHQRSLDRKQVGSGLLAAALVVALVAMVLYSRQVHRTHAELHEQRERVEFERRERLAAIGELCTGVAHGIQNPLAAIRSSAELIVDLGQIDADSRRRAGDVMTECSRLSRRVSKLLNIAKGGERRRQAVDAVELVRDVIEELGPRFAECGVELRTRMAEESAVVMSDREEVTSILIELLSNALDHSPRGEAVEVAVERNGACVSVDVRDHGLGVPEATAGRIFDLFFTTKAGGSGVGLAWAARVAQSLGGRVFLKDSSPGGATFCVELPMTARGDDPGGTCSHHPSALPGLQSESSLQTECA